MRESRGTRGWPQCFLQQLFRIGEAREGGKRGRRRMTESTEEGVVISFL